ncbi:hypothetical protein Pmani_007889 [Petrolisthes manimaculis]|uniref:Uncharacterized protein n=1 Tax=Petrolisthes manimaculis TaxID=1843537 RepID=A0AAE1Q807_9EUCA|nr:hypothetical protein Pmani_007889 [Petrolisthes manimaculis]
MKLHRSVEFAFSGSKPKLTVCGMTCMNLNPPTHFPNLPSDCRPIATPTRRHSLYDKTFIQKDLEEPGVCHSPPVTVVEPPFAPSPTPNLEPVSSERSESRETLQPSEPPEDSSSRVTSPPTVQPLRRSTREKNPVLRYPL